jgi:HEAT repeat protein
MVDEAKELKIAGLRCARSLQGAVRTAVLFPADHHAADAPLAQSLAIFQEAIQQFGQFTVGFVDRQVLLNRILTSDPTLAPLEKEFSKRGICAVTLQPGITLASYRQLIGVLATPVKSIEAVGVQTFLSQHAIDGVRIVPALQNQKRTKDGDLLVEGDSTAYLLSRQSSRAQYLSDSMEMLLESAGLEKTAITAVVSSFAGAFEEGGEGGREGAGSGSHHGPGGYSLMEMMEQTTMKALADPAGDPQKSYVALARLLQQANVASVLARFSAGQGSGSQPMSGEQMAGEFLEDAALAWAQKRISSAVPAENRFEVEEDVVRVLVRTIKATQTADRLAVKLAKLIQERMLPKHVQERVHNELHWAALPAPDKQSRMLGLTRFDAVQFRRLLEHIRELIQTQQFEAANQLAQHYLKVLELPAAEVPLEEVSRLPELIAAMSVDWKGFVPQAVAAVSKALARSDLSEFIHFQLTNALAALARTLVAQEEFAQTHAVGAILERVWNTDRAQHAKCCQRALRQLLPPPQVDPVITLFLTRRDDSALAHAAISLLRWSGAAAIGQIFARLENEENAKNRIALIRLLGLTGQEGIAIVRRKLSDERWYVVRNACLVLSELKDPELPVHLAPLLRHREERVQQAAVAAIIKSRAPGCAQVLAGGLLSLRPSVLEPVLDELMFLKDPAAVPALQELATAGNYNREMNRKAMLVLSAIGGDQAWDALGRILADEKQDRAVRQFALSSFSSNRSETGRQWLYQVAARGTMDPLAADCQRLLHEQEQQSEA